jgi:RHS repeat-associated protein
MPMPGKQMVGGELYRYAFQGQEKDPETGKEAFQLRLWDGRIGRWLTTDPAGQYASPYLGMGNNPINGIDPDGALFGRIRAWTYKLFNGGSITKNDFDKWVWSSDTQLSGNMTDGLASSEMQMKNFGYGGFGKLTATSSEYSLNGNIDFGFVNAGLDIGPVSGSLKAATTDLISFNYGAKDDYITNTSQSTDSFHYVGKNNITKGTIFKVIGETGAWGDYGYEKTFKGTIGGRPNETITNSNAILGWTIIRANVYRATKKGVHFSIGLHEDIGGGFMFQGSFEAKINRTYSWKF